MSVVRRWTAAGLVGLAACLVMAVSASSALASVWGVHRSIGQEQLAASLPMGLALDEAGQKIYVGTLNKDVQQMAYSGEPEPPEGFGAGSTSGVAVDPVNSDVYTVLAVGEIDLMIPQQVNQAVSKFAVSGSGNLFGAYTIVQIASDRSGNVYVPYAPSNEIRVFNDKGEAPTGGVAETIKGSGTHELKAPEGVAVAPNGNVWVADTADNRIEEFNPDGTFVTEITEDAEGVQALAIDDSGHVFASIGGATPHVVEYDSKGKAVAAKIGESLMSESEYNVIKGIAFDRAQRALYVVDGGHNEVWQFTSFAVKTEAASDVAEKEGALHATLHGEVNPELAEGGSEVTTCRFEYIDAAAYEKAVSEGAANPYATGETASCEPSASTPYSTKTTVSATVGVMPGKTYHYRVVGEDAEGEEERGADVAFGPPTTIAGESAEAVVATATARAKIDPNGEPTGCEVQYVAAAEYAASGFAHAAAALCTAEVGPAGTEDDVEAHMTGLAKNATYDYRFLARNASGETAGSDQTLTTFGIVPESFMFGAFGQEGEEVTQAGAHPYKWTDKFRLNTSTHTFSNGTTDQFAPDANAKNVVTQLPPGLIGNPNATAKCSAYEVVHQACGGAAQIGVLNLYTGNPSTARLKGELSPHEAALYNVVPPKGVAAQFAASIAKLGDVRIDAKVRTGSDYGVTAEVLNSTADEGLVEAEVTLWGVPAAASHDEQRLCGGSAASCSEHGPLVPFLTNPTACTGEREAHMTVEPWQEDEPPVVVGASAKMPPITGCGKLDFKPSMVIQPTASAVDSPTGLHVELTVPQNESPTGLAEADLKDAKVVLPAGMTVNASSASGLTGCPLLTGKEGHPGAVGIDMENGEGANCPDASKVGKVTIKTPLLEEELIGGVYVAQQNANPFKSLIALYIAAEAPERGVVVKLAGEVELDPTTGQLTTTFDENPQLPFETLKLDFFGGERAPLATPRGCGSYQPASLLEPWSHQGAPGEEGTPDAEPFIAPFAITSGLGGSSCSPTAGFAPPFTAGTENPQAAAFSPFVMTLTRNDGEQRLSTVSMTLPAGVSGMLSKVPLCAEAQANAGDCPAASKIGHVVAQAGVGGEPVTLPQPGKPEDPVYLTEKYEGAPFGLSIVVPAEAGPFNLGTVIVRAKLSIDLHTAQVSVMSNPMPTILQGVPLDVRTIHVDVDRPGFTFNPTSCRPMTVAGTIGSAEGASAAVSSRFQAANCAALPFHPKFTVATRAKHTRRKGAYLHVTIKSKQGQAGLRQVHVELPKALPSRLPTLQKACTEVQFASNPAGCPAASVVGHATIHTPVLPVALKGPAYFVSHGGAKFPELVMVVQGDGVTIVLNGETFISPKTSITSSTFKSTPDVPFSRFDLVLPTGVHSALAGFGDFCHKRLRMPTRIVAQSGKVLEQNTKMSVQGCKPELRIVSHKVKGLHASIDVKVPSAGKLIATGRGIARVVKRVKRKHGGRVTIAVHLSRHDRRVLAKNPHQRFNAKVKLRFTPKHGKALSAGVRLLIG